MEGHVWRIVCELLPQAQTNDGRVKCDLRSVLMLLLWSALNDRPRRWALEPSNWRFTPRPKHFISEGQLSRRARQQGVLNAMNRILSILSERLAELNATTSSLAFADGSCVAVGGASGDPDAKAGRGVGGFSRGYKIHLVSGEIGEIYGLRITPLNVYEGHPLIEMASQLPKKIKRIFADGNYDSSRIPKALQSNGIQLIAPVKLGFVGRRGDPGRIASLDYLNSPRGKRHFRKRDAIERLFGNLKSLSFGLQGLPSWVRRLHRVKRWITAKLIFYLANKIQKRLK